MTVHSCATPLKPVTGPARLAVDFQGQRPRLRSVAPASRLFSKTPPPMETAPISIFGSVLDNAGLDAGTGGLANSWTKWGGTGFKFTIASAYIDKGQKIVAPAGANTTGGIYQQKLSVVAEETVYLRFFRTIYTKLTQAVRFTMTFRN